MLSKKHYEIWLSLFGLYMLLNLILVSPYFIELYTPNGVFPSISILPTWCMILLLILAIAASFTLMLRVYPRISAVILWLYHIITYHNNPIALDPTTSYIGWFLLFIVCVPNIHNKNWHMPTILEHLVWVVMGLSYFATGVMKYNSPLWTSGDIAQTIVNLPITYTFSIFSLAPHLAQFILTIVILIQISSLLTFLIPKLRPIGWIATTLIHVSILVTFKLQAVALGMLLFHFLLYDHTWFKRKN